MDRNLDLGLSFSENSRNVALELLDKTVMALPSIAFAALIFLVSYIVASIVANVFRRMETRFEHGRSQILRLTASTSRIAILVVGAITALGTLGINVNALIAGLGLGGFAIGFALKDALSNLLSGALVLIYQPFNLGDTIAVAGCQGVVTDINLRYTTLVSDEKTFLIPNSSLFTNSIEIINRKRSS